MTINLYIDDVRAEVLEALADHDGVTIEDKANELFNDLLNKIIEDLRREVFN